jgi:hypothetical protein
VSVGYSVASIIQEEGDKVDGGIEAGEGASKLIAFIFVVGLALKLPRWFGISNYVSEKSTKVVVASAKLSDTENPAIKSEEIGEHCSADEFGGKIGLSVSLFWNAARESTEGGVFTALIVLLEESSSSVLAASVLVGVAGAIGAAIVVGFGAKYISRKGFAIAATVVASALSVGLSTGSARAFEEVYDIQHDGQNSGFIYKYGESDVQKKDVLEAFGFVGIGGELTVLVLVFWIFSIVSIALAQYWHNYLGYRLFPKVPCFSSKTSDEQTEYKQAEVKPVESN